LKRGADIKAKNDEGQKPIDLAKRGEVLKVFEEYK
jgi:hypothetical protein